MEKSEKISTTNLPLSKYLKGIIDKAVETKTSDIHIEPQRENLVIRFRINGLLYDIQSLEIEAHEPMISQIKNAAKINTAEHRLPQDGHFEYSNNQRLYNIRVSTFPTVYGQVAVLRILNRDDILIDLQNLGFDKNQLTILQKLINQPYGMILITGPSGSGKTTLLYSILNVLNKPSNNIITIEDPIELQMEKIRQTQVNESIGFTFARALRSVLRQDADIIMVGEIRDSETARISTQAALTGRLVLSTLHTRNLFAIISRLFEMGIPRSVVANALIGVISARLIRTICPHCKIEYQLTETKKRLSGNLLAENTKLYTGRGCGECFRTGFSGRTGIFEIIEFDEEIRSIIIENPSFAQISSILEKKNIKTLRERAQEKLNQGITSIDEVLRVVGTG